MKTMLTTLLSAAAVTVLVSGCGGSSSDEQTATGVTEITVERGPVLQAVVMDANGSRGEDLGAGRYRFREPRYPVTSYGGYIDINRNGTVDAGDVAMGSLRLRTGSGNVMTMATTVAQNAELYALLGDLNLSRTQLLERTPSQDLDTAALSDALYQYCMEHNISDPAEIGSGAMAEVANRFRERRQRYVDGNRSAAEWEYALVNTEMQCDLLTEADADRIRDRNATMGDLIDTLPLSELTDAQKYTLAYMWNEERMAHDLYLALNDLTPHATLYTIATTSESRHIEAVEGLIGKYDLNILDTEQFVGGYDADALAAYDPGVYSIEEISTLYGQLYDLGDDSLEDALKAGCMVEATDIADLDRYLEVARGAEDLELVLFNLRNASYSHYAAFDTALKAQGVVTGCCAAGEAYCIGSDVF